MMNERSILIGTGNLHKLKEITHILNFPDVEFKSLQDFSGITEAVEDGKTFAENAILKAREYFSQTGIPCIADDSGLVVPALGDKPGIYSSRYAGENASDNENNYKLLDELKNVKNTSAYYVCVAAFVDSRYCEIFEGRFAGYIGNEFIGENGFGYDPIFYIEHKNSIKSVAQLSDDEKNSISHRAEAIRKFKPWFKKYLEKELT